MTVFRRCAVLVAVVSALALGGCGILEPTPTPTPTETQAVIDTTKYIGGEIDPADTIWSGTDSGGDLTTITLHADGTLAIGYGENTYDYLGDTWRVRDGILRMEVYLDETNGLAQYVGTWNSETRAIDTVMRTTKTAKQLTVTLTQQ
ncbi:MAG TPA: hypothetical protein VFS93_08185 [Terrimesophilobacter sp.]|nr:hypothetical protein [Terrimesophilobacter sp.]